MPAMDLKSSVRAWIIQLPGLPDCRTIGGAVGRFGKKMHEHRAEILVSSVTNDIAKAGDEFFQELKATCRTYTDVQRRLTRLWAHPDSTKAKPVKMNAEEDEEEAEARAAANFYAMRRPIRTTNAAKANEMWAAIVESGVGAKQCTQDTLSSSNCETTSNSSCDGSDTSSAERQNASTPGSVIAATAVRTKRVQFLRPGLSVTAANVRVVPTLNGRTGLVHEHDSAADRVIVKFPEPLGCVSLRRCNLVAAAS